VKDDAECVAPSFAKQADAVSHGDAVRAARALDGAMIDSENYGLACFKRHDLDARLHPRPLFGQYKFSALKVLARLV